MTVGALMVGMELVKPMQEKIPDRLFVLEMANNHMGDPEHGLKIIRAFGAVCRKYPFTFAFKLQYRDLDTFIHPLKQGRDDVKYVKRFSETRLSRADFDRLIEEVRAQGFLAIATPFDEPSVMVIEEQALDCIKVASCSLTDWPLLERIVQAPQPVIASTAGATFEDIDCVVSFFRHRRKAFALLHCVAEYPTDDGDLHLSRIGVLRARYPDVPVGFSTHEHPGHTDMVTLAVAKGATVFEKHVGVETEAYALNAYSSSPDQVDEWLAAAQHAFLLCGDGERRVTDNIKEAANLRSLRRGIFARRALAPGECLSLDDVYFAFPPEDGQYSANEWSKYSQFSVTAKIPCDAAVAPSNCERQDTRQNIWDIVSRVKAFLNESRVIVPGSAELDISHHYGLGRFDEVGLTMITVVNRDYCKKLLVLLPGQSHPEQYHKKKEETFHVLFGEIALDLDGRRRLCGPGDVVTIEPGTRHAFSSRGGAVIEEISSTHFKDDSFYSDEKIMANKNRKTQLTYWMS